MGNPMKFNITPRDVSPEAAAKRLGKPFLEFQAVLPRLLERGFPPADPDTGNYDLDAINQWCNARHHHLFGNSGEFTARDATTVAADRIAKLRSSRP